MELKIRKCIMCDNFPVINSYEHPNTKDSRLFIVACSCGHNVQLIARLTDPDIFNKDLLDLERHWNDRDSDKSLFLLKKVEEKLSDDLPAFNPEYNNLKAEVLACISEMEDTIVFDSSKIPVF